MKIGVSSYSFAQYIQKEKCDYIKICDLAKEMGFDGIEFIALEDSYFNITTDPKACAAEIRAHCESIGLEICAYTVGADIFNKRGEAVKSVCAHIDVAKILGAPVVRFDVCYSMPSEHLTSYRTAIDIMVPYIREIADYAESNGIRVCTENHGYIFQAPERVEELILAVNHKNYGWLCDMGNFMCVGADLARSVAIAAPYTFHAHAKDFIFKSGDEGAVSGFIPTSDGNYIRGTVIGHGVVPVKRCVNILKNAGYDGWLSVEFEGWEDCIKAIKAGFANLKALI